MDPERPRTVSLGGGMRVPYPEPTSAAATAIGKGNRRAGTKPEVLLRSHLHRLGFRFRKDHLVRLHGLRVKPDIAFTRARVAVFVDGCFWHGCRAHGRTPRSNQDYWIPKLAANRARDARVDSALGEAGWQVVRVWEHEDVAEATRRVAKAVRG